MEIDYKKLEEGLETLNGGDYAECEAQVRNMGDVTANTLYSSRLHAAIAARALKCPYDEILLLPIKQFITVTTMVSNFLLGTLVDEIQRASIEKSQSV